MGDPKADLIDVFFEAQKISDAPTGSEKRTLLGVFVEFLRERGQYVDKGEIQSQLVETTLVRDRNQIPLKVFHCLVCGHNEYEVQDEPA